MFEDKKDLILLIVLSTSIFLFLVLVVIITIARYKIKQQHFFEEKIQLQARFTQTLLQSQLEIQEHTLSHISHELHDNLGQVASLIKINLNTLRLQDPQKATEKIEDTKELIRQLITDLKALSVSLGSDRITQTGLVKAIETEIERLNKTGSFEAVFTRDADLPVMEGNRSIILYRMIQEILNNIIKHSGATEIKVTLGMINNFYKLAISDNGTGFDLAEKQNSNGAGLLNLRNRAALIHAKLTINSSYGEGTNVIIEIPL